MAAPYELMAGPWTAWLADAATAEPADLDTAPPVDYVKLGASGSLNYSEDGITISEEQALEYFRGLGSTARRKAWRTEEDVMVGLTVHDFTAETIAIAKNGNAITSVAAGASTSGAKRVALYKGSQVTSYALLVRSDAGSPYGDEFKAQLWIPNVVVDSVGETSIEKGVPLGFAFSFAALFDDNDELGAFRLQNAVKSS